MLTVEQALTAILENVCPFPPTTVPLSESLGLVLANDISSDVDSPPFDKALMDGFAVRAADVVNGRASLTLIEEVAAGHVPTRTVGSGEATQIMTGAPIPDGTDAVVQVEDTQVVPGPNADQTVEISTRPVSPGTNMMGRGTSMKKGDKVLSAGRLLRPQDLGALAEMGVPQVQVRRRPRIGVLATGDELVPISEAPGPGQIRNSNETMLVAQIRRAGAEPVSLGIARDERPHLRERICMGLECDMLLLSGGVSAGKLDLVPSELQAAGVRQVFHKVKVKPGKPIWFGIWNEAGQPKAPDADCGLDSLNHSAPPMDATSSSTRYVFGLPGNPVSSMVCFELFVRTALRRLMTIKPEAPSCVRARLIEKHVARGDRPTYYPARLDWTSSGPAVEPVGWHGSSDLRATVEANAMAVFPGGDRMYQVDEEIDVIQWD